MWQINAYILPILLHIHSLSSAYDLIVYSATPAGIAAAITAAKASAAIKIAIIEPTSYIGGMAVAGGIGLGDINVEETIVGTVAFDWVQNNNKYYKVNGSHSVYKPDMYVGLQSFLDLLALYPNIELITGTGALIPQSVRMNGTRINQVAAVHDQRVWQASAWIDASYDGDLTRFSGASYTWGRESREQYNEEDAGVLPYQTFSNFLAEYPVNSTFDNGTLIPFVAPDILNPVGSADLNMMGYSYRLCITPNKEKQAPFFVPNNYDPNSFIMLQRYIDSLIASKKYPLGPPFEVLVDIFKYRGYPPGDKFDMCDSANSAFTSDAIYLNQGYVNGSAENRRQIEQKTSDYVLGMLWYILTSPLVPNNTRSTLERYGLCNDEWVENRHIPPQLYVREGLRLVNDQVFTQNHVVSGLCRNDTIALGNWGFDIHVVTRTSNRSHVNNEGQLVKAIARVNGSRSGPVFEMPYSMIVPKQSQVTNLLVPVCHAATHVAYSATRVEPQFMMLGGAAGYAAAYSVLHGNIDMQQVDVSHVQEMLLRDGALLHYPKGHCKSVEKDALWRRGSTLSVIKTISPGNIELIFRRNKTANGC